MTYRINFKLKGDNKWQYVDVPESVARRYRNDPELGCPINTITLMTAAKWFAMNIINIQKPIGYEDVVVDGVGEVDSDGATASLREVRRVADIIRNTVTYKGKGFAYEICREYLEEKLGGKII